MKKFQQGFMAITTVMILSVILLLVASSLSFSGFFTRYNILDSELKKVSLSVAEGCVDQALLELAENSLPLYPKDIYIGGIPCTIKSITPSGTSKIISVEADYKKYITNLSVTVDSTMLTILNWVEVPTS